jgi:predicted ATP-dependent Lon-type protease
MTEKHDYTASVRRKGLENTGVTPDIAKTMYNTQGRSTLAIVELAHKRQINDDDTGRSVELVITSLEPSQNPELDDHLRQLMRTLHQNRVLHSEDQALDIEIAGDIEPSVDAVIAAQRAHAAGEPHVFDPGEDGSDDCVVCGEDLEHDLHKLAADDEDPPAA